MNRDVGSHVDSPDNHEIYNDSNNENLCMEQRLIQVGCTSMPNHPVKFHTCHKIVASSVVSRVVA